MLRLRIINKEKMLVVSQSFIHNSERDFLLLSATSFLTGIVCLVKAFETDVFHFGRLIPFKIAIKSAFALFAGF